MNVIVFRHSVWKALMCSAWHRVDRGLKWGDVVVYDSAVVHKGLANKGTARRPVLYLNFRAVRRRQAAGDTVEVLGALGGGYSTTIDDLKAKRIAAFRRA